MGQVKDTAADVYRDFQVFGVPASGANDPDKASIRKLFTTIDQTIAAAIAGIVYYATGAERQADTTRPIGTLAKAADETDFYRRTSTGWTIDNTLYEGVAGVVQPLLDDAIEQAEAARDAARQAADLVTGYLATSPNPDISIAVVDEYGFARLIVASDGSLKALSLDIADLATRTLSVEEIIASSSNGIVQAWVDDYGLALAILYSDGRMETAAGSGQAALADPDGFARSATFDARAPVRLSPSGYHMVVANGQSKHRGYNAFPPLSTSLSAIDYKLSGGLITTDRGDYTAEVLAPLAEAQVPDPVNNFTDGETIVSGACQMVHSLIEQIDGVPLAQQGFSLVACAVGASGAGVVSVTDPGQQPYQRSILVLNRANTLATAAGRMFSVGWSIVEHGQTDLADGTNPTFFKNAWLTWRSNIEAAGETLTGDRRPFVMSLTQTSDHPAYGIYDPKIALAQAEMDAEPNTVCAAPTYIFQTGGADGADGIHYSPLGSKLNGVYQGIAVYWRYYKGVDWHPLKPVSKDVKGRAVYVHMHVPVRPLRLTTELVSDPGNYGFRLKKSSDGSVIDIASVRTEGDDVVIVAAADLPSQSASDVVVEYAHGPTSGTPASGPTTGARGCLCDSQGEYIVYDRSGLARRLDNYSLIFRI